MKKQLLFWIPNVLLLLPMVGSAIMYLMQPQMAIDAFKQLGYPGYVMWFNAMAKILGGIAIVAPVPKFLKEFAYAGYLYILLLATQALYVGMPANWPMMLIFIVIWVLAYWSYRKLKA